MHEFQGLISFRPKYVKIGIYVMRACVYKICFPNEQAFVRRVGQ